MLIGIDLGGTKIEGVVLDANSLRPGPLALWPSGPIPDPIVIARKRIATEAERGYDHIVERIALLVDELRASAPDCDAIGIGTPGALTRAEVIKNSNTTCLNGKPLLADLRRRLGLAVRIENDANCFALAEALAGAGRGARLVFGVILGTGVGGGIVHRGELLRGPQHLSGEWGHHCLDPNGPPCYCGQRGCVETFLSGPALALEYQRRGGAACTAEQVVSAVDRGDRIAAAVLDHYLDRFGRALANLIDIVDPDAIVIGGGLSKLDRLYREGRAAVAGYVFNDELRTAIVRNDLGDSAGVIGAALLSAAAADDNLPSALAKQGERGSPRD